MSVTSLVSSSTFNLQKHLESDCPRLPQDEAITVPMIKTGEEMPQIVLDLRVISAYTWNSAVVLFDHTLGIKIFSIPPLNYCN